MRTLIDAMISGGGFLIYCYAHYLSAKGVLVGIKWAGRKIKGMVRQ